MTKKSLSIKLLHAVILTVFTAGSLHLLMVFIASITRHDLALVNPINILGLQLVFPHLADSNAALIIGWASLVSLVAIYLYLLIHYKRYLALISVTAPYQRLKKMRQMTVELQSVIMDMSPLSTTQAEDKRPLRERLVDIITKYQANDE